MKYYAIADIAGEFDALMRLVVKLEPNSRIILLGDTVDRGPKSKEVVEWAMKTPNVSLLMGNHEHMMIDWVKNSGFYDERIWLWNGGIETIKSYFGDVAKFKVAQIPNGYGGIDDDIVVENPEELRALFPKDHLVFLENSLKAYQAEVNNKVFTLTHAPLFGGAFFENIRKAESKENIGFTYEFEQGVLWNRGRPLKRDGEIQIFGHNSHWGLRYFPDENNPYAICLDASRSRVLTAISLDTMAIIQEPYNVSE